MNELNKAIGELNNKLDNIIMEQTEKLRRNGARYEENINIKSEQTTGNKIDQVTDNEVGDSVDEVKVLNNIDDHLSETVVLEENVLNNCDDVTSVRVETSGEVEVKADEYVRESRVRS